MRAIEFDGYNVLLGPPKDMNRGECGALPVWHQAGRFCSAWKLTDEEIEALKNGAHICLVIFGESHPPVSMHVQKYKEMP